MTESCMLDDMTSAKFFDTMGKRIRILRAANRKLAATPHLLSGVCWCMDCGRPLRISTTHSGKTNRHAYLRCTARQHPFWQMRADAILPYIDAAIAELATVDIDALVESDTTAQDTSAAIDAQRREVARLQKSLQSADDAHFVAGTLDADRYARTVKRLAAEIASRQTEISELQARQQLDAARGDKRARLLDVLANGAAILASADPTAANIWLRAHLRVWLKDKAVLLVEWL